MKQSFAHRPRVAIVMSNANATRLAAGIQSFAQGRRDYWLVDVFRPLAELKALLQKWEPAGLIVQWEPEVSPALIELGFPTVLSTADYPIPGVGRVDVDDLEVGRQAATHLLETGLRNFGYLGNPTHYSGQRLEGFRARLAEAGATCSAMTLRSSIRRQPIEFWHEPDASLQQWVAKLPKPVGIFAAHDPLGRFLAEACRDAGLQIPESVAIVAADNDELVCGLTHPPLSSVTISWSKIGFETARVMEDMIQSGRVPGEATLVAPGSVSARLSSDLLAVAHPRLQEALRIIRERACDGLSVKELLEFIPIPRRTLEQEFRARLGRSPRDEIVRVRLENARRLLGRSDLSMPDIAERCGFGSAERFSVVFRQVEGIPPTLYRERYWLQTTRPS